MTSGEQTYIQHLIFWTVTTSFPSYALHRLIEMKIKAMCDCILRVKTNPIEMIHHRYVRAEAILALARWQCENAPNSVVQDSNYVHNWKGERNV